MITLITGATHTGKTALALRMAARQGGFCLSVDHLKMGLIRSGYTTLTPQDDDALTGYLWPVVRELVKTAVENRQDLIVEGCYVPFDWRRYFDGRYLADIRFICLAMTEEYIDAHFDDILAHAMDAEARLDDAWLTPERLKAENRAVINGFRAAGESVTLIEDDYEAALAAVIEL